MSVPCQYPNGDCDERDDGMHRAEGPEKPCVYCGAYPPETFEEFGSGGQCDHLYCIDADIAWREWNASRNRLSHAEREEIRNDRELFRDEFHGDEDALRRAGR